MKIRRSLIWLSGMPFRGPALRSAPTGEPAAGPGDKPPADTPPAEPQLVDQLPGWAQRHIASLRAEAAAKRVESKAPAQSGTGGDGVGTSGTVTPPKDVEAEKRA